MDETNEVKVVLLGKENSGKSCLLVRYLHHRFDPQTVSLTIGAGYGTRTVAVGSTSVVLGIWDTAGSERYSAMSRVYYRRAKAAVVCYDLTDRSSFERARFWVNEVKKHEEHCKIYLCGTKQDIVQNNMETRPVEYSLTAGYAEEINAKVFETSSKTGYNVDDVFYEVARDYVKAEESPTTNYDEVVTIFQVHNKKRNKFSCFIWR